MLRVLLPTLAFLLVAAPAPSATPRVDHAPWGALLKARVDAQGRVDYRGWAKDEADRKALAAYLQDFGRTDPSKLSRKARLAYWINLYNACTVDLILDHGPELDSIKDIPGRWKIERCPAGGDKLSLHHVEHEQLRDRLGDPRIHFAINCASVGCPVLAREPYTAEGIDRQLDEAGRRFVNSDRGLRLAVKERFFGGTYLEAEASKIFHWFDDDFEADDRSVLWWLRRYATGERKALLERFPDDDDVDVDDMSYDWSLNAQPR